MMRFKRLLLVWLSLVVCVLVMGLFGAVGVCYGACGIGADGD